MSDGGSPKKIVYLLGAGATQAEASYKGALVNLTMKDSDELGGHGVSTRALKRAKIGKKKIQQVLNIQDEVDIEKLITLLTATGSEKNIRIAESLKKEYFGEIIKGLSKAGILEDPTLAKGLLELHDDDDFKKIEELSCIISLNHDNLFQVASQSIFKHVNLGFAFHSTDFIDVNDKEADTETGLVSPPSDSTPQVIQLHGCFGWKNAQLIETLLLTPLSKYEADMLWIPPTILKESKDYPYNKLMGLSFESLVECDILRIIGCSLSQNDWNLISLIFNAQNKQFNKDNNCFKIEMIIDQPDGENIRTTFSYLKNITPIGYIKDGNFDAYLVDKDNRPKESELDNPFAFWLKTKSDYHKSKKQLSYNGETNA